MVEFIETEVDALPISALNYLQQAIDRTPSNDTDLWSVLSSGGTAFVIKDGSEEIGAIFLQEYPGILNIVLFGVSDIQKYKSNVSEFIKSTMHHYNLPNLFIASRIGWHKVFPELKVMGTFYSYSQ